MSSFNIIRPFIKPLWPFIEDPTVTEIMVNHGGRYVFVERNGRIEPIDLVLESRNLLVAVVNIARACRDDFSEAQPRLNARLEDGSRISAMHPACSPDGVTLTIRKFTERYTLEDLIRLESVPLEVASLLTQAILQHQNVLISGATGVGKTVLVNALAHTIPLTDRIVLIEETSEIHIPPPHHVVRFEARTKSKTFDAVSLDDLLRDALRHRPDRIILGEVRGAEAWSLLQCLTTGHDGSLSTIHANNAMLALTKLSHYVLMANVGLPHAAILDTIGIAIQFVVHLSRIDGARRVAEVLRVERYDAAAQEFVTRQIYTAEPTAESELLVK